MTRDYWLYISDMEEAIRKIQNYTGKLSYENFADDNMVIDAVIRNFEIIGEAAGHIPLEIQIQYPAIPWRQIKSMRNIMIHEYFGVDLEIIWKTITTFIGSAHGN